MQSQLLVLTAPPASGKTFWIDTLARVLEPRKVLVISPLRALADECIGNWGESIGVVTPEEWLKRPLHAEIIIFDEFHLFFYWGDTFRGAMWEAFYGAIDGSELCIFLTATLPERMRREIENFEPAFGSMLWCDCGNQRLKNKPSKYVVAPSREWLMRLITLTKFNSTEVQLIFCAYREDVKSLGKLLVQRGYRVWTCVGGEASEFRKSTQQEKPPHFIICTTVLSHGVNLPVIQKIYFMYRVDNIDFWIQMVARGGRRGDVFQVYSLEKPYGIEWGYVRNSLAILSLGMKIRLATFPSQVRQWFLKDWSFKESPIKKEI